MGQGAIRGKMTDAQTGETLIGANVVIKEPYKGAMADIDGNYSLDDLAPGTPARSSREQAGILLRLGLPLASLAVLSASAIFSSSAASFSAARL